MRCCLTTLLATLTLGCTHLKLNHVACMQQYGNDVTSCIVSTLLICPGLSLGALFSQLALLRRAGSTHGGFCSCAVASPTPSMQSAGHETLYALCLEPAPACACKMLHRPLQDLSLCYFRYNDVRLSFGPSCLLLDAHGRQTYQLTAFKLQPQLSQKQSVKITGTRSLYTASCTLRRNLSSSCRHTIPRDRFRVYFNPGVIVALYSHS